MSANNPHLQKKRSSKRSLGRSLMRRITEIPESMSRQCSKEEKDGSVGGASRPSSYKRRRLDSGSSSVKLKDDAPAKPKVASSLKKSHSTHDHTKKAKENSLPMRHESYKEAPLLDSMMRKKLAKKASERSRSDSLDDSAPPVYKSASAHNLMAERKPLHPKPPPLQKSLSVVTSAKEKALLLANRAYLEDSSKLAQDEGRKAATGDSTTESEASAHAEFTDDIAKAAVNGTQAGDTPERTVRSLLEDGSGSKDTVRPWGSVTAPSTPSENKPQKHVTYAPIRSVSINTSELPGRRHHASKKTPPEPPVRQQSLVHSLEPKDATAWDAPEQTEASGHSLTKDAQDRPVLANEHLSGTEDSLEKVEVQSHKQTEGNVPPSIPAGLTRLASIAAEVCPWELMEVPAPKKKDPDASESDSQTSSPEKELQVPKSTLKSLGLAIKAFNRSRVKTSARARKDDEGSPKKNGKETSEKNEKRQIAEGALTSVGGLSRQPAISRKIVSKQSTICPWDEEEEEPSSSQENRSRDVLEVCPWETSQDSPTQGRTSSTEAAPSTCADRLPRIKSQGESVCPWETAADDRTREEQTPGVSPKTLTAEKKAEACPWELVEVPPSTRGDTQEKASGLHDSKDTKKPLLGMEIGKSPDRSRTEETKSRSVDSYEFSPTKLEVSTSVKAEVCPWEAGEPLLKQKMSKEDSEGPSKEKSTAPRAEARKPFQEGTVCPWETMELPERRDAKTTLSQKVSDNKTDIKMAICPWETSDTSPEEPKEGLKGSGDRKLRRPLSEETKERENGPRDSVCPWDNVGDKDPSTKPVGKTLELGKEVLKKSSSGDSKKVEVCPWEAEAAEVCPLEVVPSALEKGRKEMEGGPSKGIALQTVPALKAPEDGVQHESVCPWDAEAALFKSGAKALGPSKASSGSFQGKKTEIAPWETQEAKMDTRAAICPWESDDTQVLRKEFRKGASALSKDEKNTSRDTASEKGGDGTKESVCPWEMTEDQELSVKPKSPSSYVSKGSSKKSDSVESFKATVCPWETEVSIKADISPWDRTSAPSDKRSSRHDVGGTLERTGDTVTRPPEKASSPRENICPWETTDVDDPSSEPSANRPGLSKVRSKMPTSIDSLKSDVCPWESQEVEPSIKAALCPWETPRGQVEERSPVKGPGAFERPAPQKEAAPPKTAEKIMSPPESICPWETMVTDKPLPESSARRTGVASISSKKSASTDTLKADVCPWESQEAEPTVKAAVCPWEVPESLEDGRPSLKGAEALKRHKSVPLKQTGHSKTTEKASSPQETICPWETMEANDPSSQPTAKSPGPAKVSSKIPSSTETLKADVCPWESQEAEPTVKAAVCPWEVPESLEDGRPSLKGAEALERHKSVPLKQTGRSKTTEKASHPQETICPWETIETNNRSSQSTAKSPGPTQVSYKIPSSTEMLKADVCPWESQEAESTVKAAVCPWEVPESLEDGRPSLKGAEALKRHKSVPLKQTGRSKTTEKASSPQETICPWETIEANDPSSQSTAKSPGPTKVSYKIPSSPEMLKADVCPWESQEAEFSTKADVCPWEAPGSSVDKRPSLKRAGAVERSKSGSFEQTLHCSEPEEPELASKKSDSGESLKAEVCPWEVVEESVLRKEDDTKAQRWGKSRSTSTKSLSQAMERLNRSRDDVCPWKSMELEGPSSRSDGQSPALSKAGSKKSDSAESLKAEVCPWEAVEESVLSKDGNSKAHQREKSRSTSIKSISEAMERLNRSRDDVCPWESMELEAPSSRSDGQSPTLSKAGSKKSDSAESLKAEVCPWEAVEESALRKDGDSKTYQREKSRSTSTTSISEAMERLNKSRDDVCPWESMELEGPSQSSARSKAGSKKSDSAESVRSEICPWEFVEEEEEANAKKEVYPWTAAVAPFEKGMLKKDAGEPLKRKQVPLGTPDSKKTGGESAFKKIEKSKSHQEPVFPWKSVEFDKPPAKSTRSLDLLEATSKKSESAESLKAEVCPWEFQEVPTHSQAEIRPWEAAEGEALKNYQGMVSSGETSTRPILRTLKPEDRGGSRQELVSSCESMELSQSPSLPKDDSTKSVSVESLRAEVCPWEIEGEEPSGTIEMYSLKTAPVLFNEPSQWQTISRGKTQLSPGAIRVEGETVSKKVEKTHSHPGSPYPQKGTDELSVKLSSKSLDLPKAASVKSDSVESLKAEICPWEIQEAEALNKADVCPWEVAGALPDKGETSGRDGAAVPKKDTKVGSKSAVGTSKALEKGSSTLKSVCSWGAASAVVGVPVSTTPAVPSPKQPDSSQDSRKSEICPWEQIMSEKKDAGPREARTVLTTEVERCAAYGSAAAMPAVSLRRSQSKQEGLPAHKPLCRSLPETMPPPIDLRKGSNPTGGVLAKSRHDSTIADVCPWETEEGPPSRMKDSAGITKASSGVHPWETEDPSPSPAISAKSEAGEKPKSDQA